MKIPALAMLLLAGFTLESGPARAPEATRDDARIHHLLSRAAYGPRPDEVAAIRETGLEAWLERQLHPQRIPDTEVERRLERLETVGLSTPELLESYQVPRAVRRQAQSRLAELGEVSERQRRRELRKLVMQEAPQIKGTPRRVIAELQSAKLIRAIYSERQLNEVLVDFWMNHFNVYARKGPIALLLGEYEREVIRPRAFGRFEELLLATARSPAMLLYLDNWLSADPEGAERLARRQARFRGMFRRPGQSEADSGQPLLRRQGLNENYARELLELHTLGVDGGYGQQDVMEVARCFTGWTIRGLRQGRPEFAFDPRVHDRRDKTVLGERIRGDGVKEGERVLHLLATHPATARFISEKLARRFVADAPPASLIERAAQTFERSDGDIRAVLKTILTSPEFQAPQAREVKVKTPLEFVVSAVRATDTEVWDARELSRRMEEMGMPLYLQQLPTGYEDSAEAWVATSGLLARLNVALDLVAGRVRGTSPGAPRSEERGAMVDVLTAQLVPSGLSEATRAALEQEKPDLDRRRVAGLILGSPEFQRR